MRTRYRIAVTDTLDALSAYVTSNTIQRMNRPETPIVAAPRNFSTIYNTTPRFLIKTGGTPDGRTQKIIVIINGTSYNSVTNATMFSVSGSLTNGVATIFKAPTQTLGSKTIIIRCENDAGASAEETRTITIAALTVEDIVPGVTLVKAAHMQSLRDAANSVRLYYGLSASIWQEVIIASRTQVRDWPLHMKELRTALDAVIVTINGFDTVAAFDVPLVSWIVFSPGSPRAAVMQQVITLISNL
ncbi:hypothetical protein AGMMS49992_31050 [Clostridia bacterium]|nr:hypothetical protein AGMMS49992_31050 [Clostridia bacterium]